MSIVKLLLVLGQIASSIITYFKTMEQRKIGAMQRDNEEMKDELQRTEAADIAMRDAATHTPDRVRNDPANRGNKQK